MLRWMATIQPGYREPWAAVGCGAPRAERRLVVGRVGQPGLPRTVHRPGDDDRAPARALLGIALGAKEAGERGLATDVVRLALGDGRLTRAARRGARGRRGSAATARTDGRSRWPTSPHLRCACRCVAEAIAALPALAERPPAKLVPLLRLLDEILAGTRAGLSDADAASLASLSAAGGQARRLARSILTRGGASISS